MKQGDVTTQDEAVIEPLIVRSLFTRNLATEVPGTFPITGIGFRPTYIECYMSIPGQPHYCIATGRPSSVITIYTGPQPNWNTTNTSNFLILDLGPTNVIGMLDTMDVDGFTITWSKNNSPTGVAVIVFAAYK